MVVIRGAENRGRNKGLFAEGGDPCLVLPQFLVRKERSFSPFYSYRKSQTIGLARIGVGFCFKPLVWPKSGVGFASNHWFGPNRGRVLLQTIGLARIGGRFCFKPPGLTPIGVGFCIKPPGLAPIAGAICIKPPGLAPIAGRFRFKPPGLTPSTPRKALVFSVRYSLRAGVRQGSPCRWRRRRR